MTLRTPDLHAAFLRPFGDRAHPVNGLGSKPLLVDLDLPLPPRLRVYAYNLVGGVGTVRDFEYKAVLRVRGQKVGHYGTFDHSGGRLAVLVAYRDDLDVFVLWDASLHFRFKNGGNIQIRTDTIMTAAATGFAEQRRALTSINAVEIVLVCQSHTLVDTLQRRVALTGGVLDEAHAG